MFNLGDIVIIDGEPYAIFQVDSKDYRLLGINTHNRWDSNNLYGVTLHDFIDNVESENVQIQCFQKEDK